ncbi:MAG: InlB B-repeat-containing protein [Lachnospiraceae bacterium]|jgi:hypothetical protein|nr:InlB B-repeat-containing protein [Lachnospiraceae bacterium]
MGRFRIRLPSKDSRINKIKYNNFLCLLILTGSIISGFYLYKPPDLLNIQSYTVKASQVPDKVNVYYYDKKGNEITAYSGCEDYGSILYNPGAPSQTGYEFIGWYLKDSSTKWIYGKDGTTLTLNNGVTLDSDGVTGRLDLVPKYKAKQYNLIAQDFSYGIHRGDGNTKNAVLTKEDVLYYGNMKLHGADDNLGGTYIEINSGDLKEINNNIEKGILGEYPLKIYNLINDPNKEKPRTIVVSLKNIGSNIIGGVDFIEGNSIIIGSNEYANQEGNKVQVTKGELLYRAQVEGIFSEFSPINRKDIDVSSSDIDKINKALINGNTGEYLVKIKNSTSSSASIKISVSLRNHGSGVLPAYSESQLNENTTNGIIGASDLTIKPISILTESKGKTLANVIGKDMYGNNYFLSDISVDENQLEVINTKSKEDKKGIYPLTYETPVGDRITVKVKIL